MCEVGLIPPSPGKQNSFSQMHFSYLTMSHSLPFL